MNRTSSTQAWNSRFFKNFSLTVLVACFGAAAYFLNVSLVIRAESLRKEQSPDSADSVSFRWHPTLYRFLTFGHAPSSVDWLLIRFLVDSNLTHVKPGEETEVFRILNLATDLDPAFFELYTAGGNFLAVARNDREGSRKILQKGDQFLNGDLKSYPSSFVETVWKDRWRIPFTLGYVYLFEFQDLPNAVRTYAQLQTIPTTPPALRARAERIQTPEGQYSVGLNTLALLKQWHSTDEVMVAELVLKERMFLFAKDLYFWNRGFVSIRAKNRNRPMSDLFNEYRQTAKIPETDPFGGKIYLIEATGHIDTETGKVPVLGLTPVTDPVK